MACKETWQEKHCKEPWQVKYYEELSITEKEALASRADKTTALQIRELPEYHKLEIQERDYRRRHPGMSTGPGYRGQVELYTDRFEANLKAEVLKDYPETHQRGIVSLENNETVQKLLSNPGEHDLGC